MEPIERLFCNAVDADGQPLAIGVHAGHIAWMGAAAGAPAARERVDLGGQLVLPGLVDGHIHLDKSFVGDRWHPHQPAADLRARLAAEKRALADARPAAERAEALIAQAAAFGTVAMRCHVDVDATTGLTNLHAVMQARERWAGRVRIQLVAFPQAGVMSCPGTVEVMDAALRAGVEVVGGIDPTTLDGDAPGQLDAIFRLAERHGARIDLHLHEPGAQGIATLLDIAARTRAAGLAGRVAVSHAYALGEVDAASCDHAARALADAGVAIMTNAPGTHAFPPVLRLRAAGVRVFAGNDNIRDAWWPYGSGDMLQRAMLIGYRSGFYSDADLRVAFDLATQAAADVIGLADYGLRVGNPATFLVLNEPNAAAVVAAGSGARRIVRRGVFSEPTAPAAD